MKIENELNSSLTQQEKVTFSTRDLEQDAHRLEELIKELSTGSPPQQQEAASQLTAMVEAGGSVEIVAAGAVPHLARALTSKDGALRDKAARALELLFRKGIVTPVLMAGAVPLLVEIRTHGRWELDEEGVQELEDMSEEEAKLALLQLLDSSEGMDSHRAFMDMINLDAHGEEERAKEQGKKNEDKRKKADDKVAEQGTDRKPDSRPGKQSLWKRIKSWLRD